MNREHINLENLQILIDTIKNDSIPWLKFNMREWVNLEYPEFEACIGGYANILYFGYDNLTREDVHLWSKCNKQFFSDVPALAFIIKEEYLDENYNIDNCYDNKLLRLFYPDIVDVAYEDIPKEAALLVLQHFKDTGKVDWSIAGYETEESKLPMIMRIM